MKKKWILLSGVLAVGMCFSSAVHAAESTGSGIMDEILAFLEDEDVKDTLFGEDGLVSGLLPEGTDMQAIEEKLGVVKSQAAEIVDTIQSKIDSADGSFDISSLEDIAGPLMEALTGSDLGGIDDFGSYFETYDAINDAMRDYYHEKNSEAMDPADVQIMSITYGYQDRDYDLPEFRFIPVLSQLNYSQDGDVLRLVSGASDVVMFTLNKAEDGSINILDAVYAEDGEGWADSLQAMADAAGCPVEEILDGVNFTPYTEITNMISYLDEHEDIKGIEYQGEIKNRDELEAIGTAMLNEMYPEEGTESEVEDMSVLSDAEDLNVQSEA